MLSRRKIGPDKGLLRKIVTQSPNRKQVILGDESGLPIILTDK